MEELRILRSKSPKDLWCEDLDSFIEALNVSSCYCTVGVGGVGVGVASKYV